MKTRTVIATFVLVFAAATAVQAAESRILEAEIDATQVNRVTLTAGVGDVIVAGAEGDLIRLEATLSPRRGGFFSSLKAAEQQVREAELKTEISGGTLSVRVTGDSDRRFEEDWAIVLPPNLVFVLEHGVGEVSVTGLRSGVEIEAGVSEVTLTLQDGPIDVEVGVGNILIRTPMAAYGSVEAASGVGAARIEAGDQRIAGEGFVGHSAEWEGHGRHDIEAASGVGDIRVVLE